MPGRTALITGASRGIGRELTLLLARDGYSTVLVARAESDLRELADTLEREQGIDTAVLPADLSRPEAAQHLHEELLRRKIVIDILINNAGFGVHGRLDEVDPSTTFDMLQLNVVTVTQLSRYVLDGMLDRGYGKILNVASTAGFQPGPLMAVYYASKAYVLSFSEALAEELRNTPVAVTALAPGPTSTEFQTRADIEGTLIGSGSPFMMDAESVARAGYRGLMEGKDLVIPGMLNKLHHQVLRLAPRRLVIRMAQWMQEKR